MSALPESPKHEAFMALFVRHEPAIHSFLTSLLVHLDDAEVVMQETSLAMWRKFAQFEPGTSFRNWAFQIARFEAMNFRRKRQRDRHLFSDELIRLLADEAEQHAARLEEERRALAHCVAKLDSRDRDVLAGGLPGGLDDQSVCGACQADAQRRPQTPRSYSHRLVAVCPTDPGP